MTEEQNKPKAPYIAFKTLTNLLERLEPEPPPRIDRSVLSYLSGGYLHQVRSALRDLQLIEENGTPTPELVSLVSEPATRRERMRHVLERTYPEVFKLDLAKATWGQLEETFKVYGLGGETKKKALVFFIKGAEYCEVPLSALITEAKIKRTPGGSSPNKGTTRKTQRNAGGGGKPSDSTENVGGSNTSGGGGIRIHPMLEGAIQWLFENGRSWTKEQSDTWTRGFSANVLLVYPPQSSGRSAGKAKTHPAPPPMANDESRNGDVAEAEEIT